MRIVHVITGLGLGGAETQLVNLATAMHRAEHDVKVVSLIPGGHNAERLRIAGVPVFTLAMRGRLPGPHLLWNLLRRMGRFQPDVLQSWLYHADLFALLVTVFQSQTALFWNLRCSRLNPQDHHTALFAVIRLLALSSRRPEAVIANSEAGKRFHGQMGYRPKHWEIIPNALDTDFFRPSQQARADVRVELGVPEATPLVGLVARFHPMKDHLNFLQGAARVREKYPHTHFVLIGAGADQSNPILTDAVRDLRIQNCAHLLGERTDINTLQAALDLAVCCSYSEGFPNVLGEAMSCCVPCVSTDVGDARRIVCDTGEIVPPKHAEALAAGIVRLLGLSLHERRALGERARRRVLDNFSIAAVLERYLELYRRVPVKANRAR